MSVLLQAMGLGSGRYVCPYCGKRLKCGANLQLHINTHLGVYRLHCEICSKGFQQKHHLLAHMASTHDVEEFKSTCPICNRKFSRGDNMKLHVKNMHKTEYLNKASK